MDNENEKYDPLDDPQGAMPMYDATLAHSQETGIVGNATRHRPTLTETLLHRKANLEKELELVSNALKIASEQQGAMSLLDSLAKTGKY